MRLCLTTVVYLSGLAACSHQGDNRANSAEAPQTATEEARMRPASLEAAEPTRSAPATTPVTPRADATHETSAPLVADTKGAGRNDFNGGSAPTPNKEETTTAKTDASDANRPSNTQPDNTAVNERDRKSQTPTPLDQGNNKQDLDITQQIRKSVMADKTLSFTAKNIKIITTGGKVTLRGPVNTAEERNAIDAAARKVVGSSNVDNQIEIKK